MTDPIPLLFDRIARRRNRARAAAAFAENDFLFREIGARLMDRLTDVRLGEDRPFDVIADIGAHTGTLAGQVLSWAQARLGAQGHPPMVIATDTAPGMVRYAPPGVHRVAADDDLLPLAEGRFDLILSNLSLHWADDLPGALVQIRRALRPDGLFLGALLGGETLIELRDCLIAAELAERGGISPRVSPVADLRDVGGLMQRAGFALPVIDGDRLTVTYANALDLMRDLRRMGEGNALRDRPRQPTRRAVLLRVAAEYQARHAGPDGRITASFDVIFMTGWSPHASQPQPLKPGSATARLADALQGVAPSIPPGNTASDRP